MKTILNSGRRLGLALMMGASAAGLSAVAAAPVRAQAVEARAVDIPAQPLGQALAAFSRATGVDVTYGAALPNVTAAGVSGRLASAEVLSRLLAGSGLTYHFTSPTTVRLEAAPREAEDVIRLGAVRIEGAVNPPSGGSGAAAGWDGAAASVYSTPGSVSVISRQTLEAYPGTSPADMLKSVTGLLSGEARNSGGLDVNIRGMQGQGRVPVTVDGSLNGTTVYRGYQGTSNRTFIDPDFISSIAIEKGPSMGSAIAGGIGGSVSMTTINVDDVVPEGDVEGLRFKYSLSTNSSEPRSSETQNLLEPRWAAGDPLATLKGLKRPALLQPTGGSGSLVYGRKSERLDVVAGFAFRRSGNYHAGTEGGDAPKRVNGPSAFCASGPTDEWLSLLCANAASFYAGHGSTPFVGGEAVLNTSTDTRSVLVKTVFRPTLDQTLELGYGGYWSTFGENYPSDASAGGRIYQRGELSNSDLDRFTARYRWNPESALIDLKANAWLTRLEESSSSLFATAMVRRYIDTLGGDLSNSSAAVTPLGPFAADYGVSYLSEETGPVGEWLAVGAGTPGREGRREEVSLFSQARLEPASWLRLDAGLRYQEYWLKDRQSGQHTGSQRLDRNEDALSFSLGATVMPADGVQVFATYKQASRLPSLLEATSGFFMLSNPDLHKEQARNWEVGANYVRGNLFSNDDELGLKLVWFENDTQDYIARRYLRSTFQMQMYNIDRARFRGLEANASYRIGRLAIEAGATWYDEVLFCRPGEGCIASSLASDYATNYIPPKFAANLSVSRDFLGERLNLGARATYRGKRAVTFEETDRGYAALLGAVPWDPYTTIDLTGRYKVGQGLSLDWSVENLTDRFYVEALSLGAIPAPGRTIRVGLTGQLGAASVDWPTRWLGRDRGQTVDWSGAYVGLDLGYGFGREAGTVTNAAGAPVEGGRVHERLENIVAGLHGGMNWQFDNHLVLGLEADVSAGPLDAWSGVKVSDPEAYSLVAQGRLESTTDYAFDWQASLRGRVGYALGRSLLYATGGPALLRETQTRTQFRSNNEGSAYGGGTFFFFDETSKVKRRGWTLGGGLERAVGERWSLRAEYLYSHFGKRQSSFDKARAGVSRTTQNIEFKTDPVTGEFVFDEDGWLQFETVVRTGTSEIVSGRKVRTDADLHSLRFGVSYRF
jgi:hemoglobin/transferrin/lactoferrin receptor protein